MKSSPFHSHEMGFCLPYFYLNLPNWQKNLSQRQDHSKSPLYFVYLLAINIKFRLPMAKDIECMSEHLYT